MKTDKDLIKELSEDTETPVQAPVADASSMTVNEDDFEEEPEHEAEPAPEEKPLTQAKIKSIARSWVRIVDNIQRMSFKPMYKKAILNKGDVESIKDFKKRHPGLSEKKLEEALHDDERMYDVGVRMDRFLKAMETLPFNEEEKEELSEPIAELLEKYAYLRLSPEWSLVISVALIMLPRLEYVMPNVSDLFKAK